MSAVGTKPLIYDFSLQWEAPCAHTRLEIDHSNKPNIHKTLRRLYVIRATHTTRSCIKTYTLERMKRTPSSDVNSLPTVHKTIHTRSASQDQRSCISTTSIFIVSHRLLNKICKFIHFPWTNHQ